MDRPISLEQLSIASPCPASWDDMVGDDQRRYCGRCRQHVYDLSAMTRSDAEAFLRKHGESRCVRFFRRADGTVLTQNCPVGLARMRLRLRRVAAGIAALLGMAIATRSESGLGSATTLARVQPFARLRVLVMGAPPAPPVAPAPPVFQAPTGSAMGTPMVGKPRF